MQYRHNRVISSSSNTISDPLSRPIPEVSGAYLTFHYGYSSQLCLQNMQMSL